MTDQISRLHADLEGRYAIERELGEAGMATVYLAKDIKHNRKVAFEALKPAILHPSPSIVTLGSRLPS